MELTCHLPIPFIMLSSLVGNINPKPTQRNWRNWPKPTQHNWHNWPKPMQRNWRNWPKPTQRNWRNWQAT